MTTLSPTPGFILGCGTFGGIGGARELIGRGLSKQAACDVMDEAVALRICTFDTAEAYANGTSENWIGEWLRERNDDIRLITKIAPPKAGTLLDSEFIMLRIKGSLRRLQVSHVHAYLLHAPHGETPIEVSMSGLVAARSEGLTETIGACNISVKELCAAQTWANRSGVEGLTYVQNMFNLTNPAGDADVRRVCREQSIRYIPFSPLAGGLLTGKYKKGHELPANSRLSLREDFKALLRPELFQPLDVLEAKAASLGCTMSALALRWVAEHPDVFEPIVGASRSAPHLAHVSESMALNNINEHKIELEESFLTAQ
jgi:aryl-alcohol dehydrogenase-like predicted oxidoreductase